MPPFYRFFFLLLLSLSLSTQVVLGTVHLTVRGVSSSTRVLTVEASEILVDWSNDAAIPPGGPGATNSVTVSIAIFKDNISQEPLSSVASIPIQTGEQGIGQNGSITLNLSPGFQSGQSVVCVARSGNQAQIMGQTSLFTVAIASVSSPAAAPSISSHSTAAPATLATTSSTTSEPPTSTSTSQQSVTSVTFPSDSDSSSQNNAQPSSPSQNTAVVAPMSNGSVSESSLTSKRPIIIGSIVGGVVLLLLIVLAAFFFYRRHRTRKSLRAIQFYEHKMGLPRDSSIDSTMYQDDRMSWEPLGFDKDTTMLPTALVAAYSGRGGYPRDIKTENGYSSYDQYGIPRAKYASSVITTSTSNTRDGREYGYGIGRGLSREQGAIPKIMMTPATPPDGRDSVIAISVSGPGSPSSSFTSSGKILASLPEEGSWTPGSYSSSDTNLSGSVSWSPPHSWK